MKKPGKKAGRYRPPERKLTPITPELLGEIAKTAAERNTQQRLAWTILGRADEAKALLQSYAAAFGKTWTGDTHPPEVAELLNATGYSKMTDAAKNRLAKSKAFFAQLIAAQAKADVRCAKWAPYEYDLSDAAWKLRAVLDEYARGNIETAACNLALLFVLVERIRIQVIESLPKRGRMGNRTAFFAYLDGLEHYRKIDLTPARHPKLHALAPNAKTFDNYVSEHGRKRRPC